jgi:hypothetical protein
MKRRNAVHLLLVLAALPMAAAHAYPRATIHNRTLYPARVEVNYPGCSNDKFNVPAATLKADGTLVEGVATAPTTRGGCLITWISATLTGAPSGVTRYTSSGTSYSQFIIAPTQTEFRVYSEQEYKAQTATEEMSPGFSIKNSTKWPLAVGLYQIGCLYHGLVHPGDKFERKTGAVWFTIRANIQPDGKDPVSDWNCAAPIAAVVGSVLLAAVTGGASVAEIPAMAGSLAAITTSQAVTISGAAVAAGAGAAATSSGVVTAIGTALLGSASGVKTGQYAGPDWPFRCDARPTYEITGGWGAIAPDGNGGYKIDPGPPLKITKTNSCGNSLMRPADR